MNESDASEDVRVGKKRSVSVPKLTENSPTVLKLEFEIEELSSAVTSEDMAGHCGSCGGCHGCNH